MRRSIPAWNHAAAIALLGFALRFWNMAFEPMNYDEMAAALCAAASPSAYFQADFARVRPDFCPPLFWLLLKPFAALSLSPLALRLPSVLLGTLAGVMAATAGRVVLEGRVAVLAGYALALHPLAVAASQEAQPGATAMLLAPAAAAFMVRATESGRARHLLALDACLLSLLHLARGSVYFFLACLAVHLARVTAVPSTEDQRRPGRMKGLATVAFHYAIVALAALPWLRFVPERPPWMIAPPTGADLLATAGHLMAGLRPWRPFGYEAFALLPLALLLPPLRRGLSEVTFRGVALMAVPALAVAFCFADSRLGKPRFIAAREAAAMLPFAVAGAAVLVARCNPLVRAVLATGFGLLFLGATINQNITRQNRPWDRVMAALDAPGGPAAGDTVAFEPPFARIIGDYHSAFARRDWRIDTAEDVLTRGTGLAPDRPLFFVGAQFLPARPTLYTLRGTLRRNATASVLYDNQFDTAIKAEALDRGALRRWYESPEEAAAVDRPTSETMFHFAPGDTSGAFDGPKFHTGRADTSYERDGRLVAWTALPHTDLDLTVSLQTGNYLLSLHCSPTFDVPAALGDTEGAELAARPRSVDLVLKAFEERRVRVSDEQTIRVQFAVENEITTLPLHLEAMPMVKLKRPARMDFGLKIFSISIEPAVGSDAAAFDR